jgi:hypothetical protein
MKLPIFLKFYLHRSLIDILDKIMGGLLSNNGNEKDDPASVGNDKR